MATNLRFKDKVVIVTGGCSGIGQGCVEVFGEEFKTCIHLFVGAIIHIIFYKYVTNIFFDRLNCSYFLCHVIDKL